MIYNHKQKIVSQTFTLIIYTNNKIMHVVLLYYVFLWGRQCVDVLYSCIKCYMASHWASFWWRLSWLDSINPMPISDASCFTVWMSLVAYILHWKPYLVNISSMIQKQFIHVMQNRAIKQTTLNSIIECCIFDWLEWLLVQINDWLFVWVILCFKGPLTCDQQANTLDQTSSEWKSLRQSDISCYTHKAWQENVNYDYPGKADIFTDTLCTWTVIKVTLLM